jgi:hypothetical protein
MHGKVHHEFVLQAKKELFRKPLASSSNQRKVINGSTQTEGHMEGNEGRGNCEECHVGGWMALWPFGRGLDDGHMG